MSSSAGEPTPGSILIVGAGVFGTSTAYHLSLIHPAPSRITVVDRTPSPPTPGASTDINKIVRADYASGLYMDLAYEALEAWASWPLLRDDARGDSFFHRSGWINLIEAGSDTADRIRANFRSRGEDPTVGMESDEELRGRWGGLLQETRFEGLKGAYWNPQAGWADAGAAVRKMMDEACKRGVRYVVGDVEEIVLKDDGVRGVRLRSGQLLQAEKVLLCTGAWTSALMTGLEDELGIGEEDRIERQITAAGVCVAHFRLDEDELCRLRGAPVLVYGENGEVIPPPTRRDAALGLDGYGILKYTNAKSFTNHVLTKSGRRISVPRPDQHEIPEELKRETLDRMILRSLPQFANGKDVAYWRLCWDGITPDQNQLICRHPHSQLQNLYFAVGGSFHSWKFMPIIGKYVCNVLQHKSNGEARDKAWAWKSGRIVERGPHEKLLPRRDLNELEDKKERGQMQLNSDITDAIRQSNIKERAKI